MTKEEKKPVTKVQLDSEDILPDEIPADTAAGEEAGNAAEPAPDDAKVTLDIEGVLDEDIPQELEIPAGLKGPAPEQASVPASELHHAAKPARFDFTRIKQLPVIKIALIGGSVAFVGAMTLLVVALVLRLASDQEGNEHVRENTEQEIASGEEQADNATGQKKPKHVEIELEPFVIPVQGGSQGYVRLAVVLQVKHDAVALVNRSRDQMRLTIYNMLIYTDMETFRLEDKQNGLCQELLKRLNTVLAGDCIVGVGLSRVLIL
ncbi:MAG: hypothetical protein N3B18_00220 [Desulfobacterota bacterium]|nr:hypothetical protein [Thermodesulfobacteriota bacterium]